MNSGERQLYRSRLLVQLEFIKLWLVRTAKPQPKG